MRVQETEHVLVRTLRPETVARVVRGSACEDGSCRRVAEALGVGEFALVPIPSRGGPIGVLVADNAITQRPIDSVDLDILRLFAGYAGTAIEKARLYSRLVEEKNELEMMHHELRRNQQTIIELQRLSDLGEMTARMAHGIRNPLVSIGGCARRLLSETDSVDPRRRHLQIIADEVTRLETILTEVLDYARPLRPKTVRTDLNQLIRETLEAVAPEREGLGVDLVLDLDESIGHVPLDANLFRIAMVNLIRNALQAIPRMGGRSGRITVRTEKRGSAAKISVMDNGTGIASDAVARIFEPFFTTKASGSGLGLPIVSQILKEHGGRVRVESRPGEGAAFHLDLPLEKGSAA
jgi:signal transduction histidine kinase